MISVSLFSRWSRKRAGRYLVSLEKKEGATNREYLGSALGGVDASCWHQVETATHPARTGKASLASISHRIDSGIA